MRDSEFQQVLDRVERNKSEATAAQYLRKIRDFREWIQGHGKEFEEAEALDVEDWLAELDERYNNASSVGKGSAALVAAYDELDKLVRAGRINADTQGWAKYGTPPKQVDYSPQDTATQKTRETRQESHYLQPEQVKELAASANKLRDELIIKLLFQTGIRVSELVNIRLQDIDTDERSIQIRGKGRKYRPVYYQDTLSMLMNVWLTERREAVFYAEESEYLFPTSHAEKITRQTVAEVVRKAAEEAGIQEVYGTNTEGVELHTVTPHVLRHSFAMAALDRGWDVYTLSQALGHESTEITTKTYLHDDNDAVKNAYFEKGPRESV